jgi:ribosomal-protein-alanine N-acetyltransferase
MKQPSLKTERLILRPFEMSDAPRVKLLVGDRAIADTTLNIPHPYEDGMAEQWIRTHKEGFEKGELANFAIILKENNTLTGAIGLVINQRWHRAELGYWIAKDFWNQGYGSEAAERVLEYGFMEKKLNKIFASHLRRNPASGRIMKKIGMKKEGEFQEHVLKWDKYEDLIFYGITLNEWKEIAKEDI